MYYSSGPTFYYSRGPTYTIPLGPTITIQLGPTFTIQLGPQPLFTHRFPIDDPSSLQLPELTT